MTEDQKYEIAVLAEDHETKRQYWECLGMQNAYGKSAEEQVKISIKYEIAETEMRQAWMRLVAAKREIARS